MQFRTWCSIVKWSWETDIIIFLSFLNCDWLLIWEVQWFYWTQKLLVPAEKVSVRMPMMGHELATPRLQTECSSHWAIQLKSYCCEGVDFIQLVYSKNLRIRTSASENLSLKYGNFQVWKYSREQFFSVSLPEPLKKGCFDKFPLIFTFRSSCVQ